MRKQTYMLPVISGHRTIVLAGIAGAAAEVVWIALYCGLTPLRGSDVLRGIATTVLPASTGAAWAPAFGLLVHFALGVGIAYAFAATIWSRFARRRGADTTLVTSVAALAAIWATNFFVVLPAWNADFVALIPYGVTFESKILFGIVMALVFNLAPVPHAKAALGRFGENPTALVPASRAAQPLPSEWSRHAGR